MGKSEEYNALMNKVASAAAESYNDNNKELEAMENDKLFEVGFLHGYNSGHNIYDVAEEKIDILSKDGETPQLEYPTDSINGTKKAEDYLRANSQTIMNTDKKSIYTDGYRKGFEEAWKDIPDEAMNEKMDDLINYYLK